MSDQRLRIVIDALNQAKSELTTLKSEIEGVNTSAGGAAKGGLTGMYDKITGIMGQAAVAGGILVGFGAAVKKAYEFGEEGMQIQRLETASHDLAASMGSDMDEIVTAVKAASLGTVSDYDIMASASRAMMLGISADADELASLMEVAAFRGRAMGLSSTQAFNDIVTGIGRMSPLILDNLGIVIDADATMGAYATSIGKTAEQLSSAERRQALLNAVLADGAKQLAAVGGLQEDAATQTEQLSAHWKDFTDKLKEWAAEPVGNVVTGLDNILFRAQKLAPVFAEHSQVMEEQSTAYEEYSTELERAAEVAGYNVNANGDLVKTYYSLYGTTENLIQANYRLSESQWDAQYATRVANETTQELVTTSAIYDDQLRKTLPSQTSINTALYEGGNAARDAKEGVKGLHNELYGFDDLNIDFGSQIVRELDKIKFYLAGGQPLQAVTEAIQQAIDDGAITPEQAQAMFSEAYVASQVLQTRMDEITADQAAQNVANTLNISLEDAKKLLDDVNLRFAQIPSDLYTTLHINIETNGGVPYTPGTGTGGATIPGDYNPDTGEWYPQAAGGSYLVRRPTTFVAGEYVPEVATFTPLTHGGSETITNNNSPTVALYVSELSINRQEDIDWMMNRIAERMAQMR